MKNMEFKKYKLYIYGNILIKLYLYVYIYTIYKIIINKLFYIE